MLPLLILADAPPDTRVELTWQHWPASWGVFLLFAAVGAALYAVASCYRRELASCPLWGRRLLAGLRSLVVLLLVGIALGPALEQIERRTLLPAIVIARDASLSMNITDQYDKAAASAGAAPSGRSPGRLASGQSTRTEVVNTLLTDNGSELLQSLASKGSLQVLDFGGQATRVGLSRERSAAPSKVKLPQIPPLLADQRITDLAGAIHAALAADRPAAIVLFTDGQHTAGGDPLAAARQAKVREVPLLIVGIGASTRRTNVQVTKVISRARAWQDEPFEIDAVLAFENAGTQELLAELTEQPIDDEERPIGGGRIIETVSVQPPASGSGQATARFSHTVRAAGKYVYSVRVEAPATGETNAESRASSDMVQVLSRGALRVLLVAGSPTWDYRLVQTLLSRDKTIGLSCWLPTLDPERGQEGTRPIARLPANKAELFEYDVVLLFDPDPAELDEPWVALLKQFVAQHAGGVAMVAGPQHFGRLLASPQTSELASLLPVSFEDVAALEVAALVAPQQRAWPLRLLPEAADHPVVRFAAERDETLRRWQGLPGIYWSFPCSGAKPATQILLEHSDPVLQTSEGARPLLVAGRYGLGRTLYLGFSDTWRWRKAGGDAAAFDRFWIQTVRFLAEGRSLEGRRQGYVETDRERYELGERITIRAQLHDAAFDPLVAAQVPASVQAAGAASQTISLLAVPNQPGVFAGSLPAQHAAVHKVQVELPAGGAEAAQTSFRVELPSRETRQVWLNRPLLEELARLSGGRYFELSDVGELAAAVPDRAEVSESRSEPKALWDSPGVLAALIGLLCTEWLLRKRFRLL